TLYFFAYQNKSRKKSRYRFNKRRYTQRYFVDKFSKCSYRTDICTLCFKFHCTRKNRHPKISFDFSSPIPNSLKRYTSLFPPNENKGRFPDGIFRPSQNITRRIYG